MTGKKNVARLAFRFVIIIGIVNLFADFTYEGGRSIMGPFLATLGASGTIVGFMAGFGELMGFGLRSVSGYIGDKTHKYWIVAFIGYAINMLAVPALALAGNWPIAAALMVLERTGRALRRPNVETMLSYSTKEMGAGWVFGLNEALDQAGATLGPLVVALVLYLRGGYRDGFAILLVSALLCMATLVIARVLYPRPQDLERREAQSLQTKGFSKTYWLYLLAGALIAAGFADFALISFHFEKAAVVSTNVIPVLYAVAMATGAIAALAFGRLLDRIGFAAILIAFFLSAFFAPLVFLGGFAPALIGMILWGIGLGAQDSLLKAIVSRVAPQEKRSTAFGVFDAGFGVAWFLGSAMMGFLYDRSIPLLIAFSVVLQLAALPVLFLAKTGVDRRSVL
jgi:predicted MFS family arabinose efflux permease